MRNRIFSLLLVLFVLIGISVFLNQENVSEFERRQLATNEQLINKNILDNSFQTTFESILKDQFPLKNIAINAYYECKVKLYDPVMSGIVKLKDDVIYMPDSGYYIRNILKQDAEKEALVASKGYNIKEFAEIFQDKKIYVYQPVRLEQTSLLDFLDANSYGIKYRDIFLREIGDKVKYNELQIDSIEDYQRYYFKTDFHWNIDGAYQGYKDIINMIGEDFEIGKPKEIKRKYCFDKEFYGAQSNAIGRATGFDFICDAELEDVSEYDYFVNGQISDDNYTKLEYAKGYKEDGCSDYEYYFGNNDFERIYDFHDESKPNLLIFADSFTNPIKKWVSSHFNRTVIIDIRSVDMPNDFSIRELMDEYEINVVLISPVYINLYFNGYYYLPLS